MKDKDGKDQEIDASILNVVPTDDHILPQGFRLDSVEIARVEQVFDIRTVPIKRIEALVLGHLDSRNAKAQLLPPSFIKEDPKDGTGTGTGDNQPGGMGPPGVGSVGGGLPGLPGGGPPGIGPGGPGGPGGANTAGPRGGGGPLLAIADSNKKRYLEVTEQVRRLPVGIVVVVDQAYIQDVLLSYANSPLRFQITQVAWTRFRGTLEGASGTTGGASEPGSGIDIGRGGSVNFGGGDPDERGPRPPIGGGSGGGPRPPLGPPGMGIPPGMGGFNPPGFGPGGFGGNAPSVISDSQVTAGLVELSIYGIVSIYEKPPEPPKPEGTPEQPKTPEVPKTPMPMVPGQQNNPKKRRRA